MFCFCKDSGANVSTYIHDCVCIETMGCMCACVFRKVGCVFIYIYIYKIDTYIYVCVYIYLYIPHTPLALS